LFSVSLIADPGRSVKNPDNFLSRCGIVRRRSVLGGVRSALGK
jgi:hypothetical protein